MIDEAVGPNYWYSKLRPNLSVLFIHNKLYNILVLITNLWILFMIKIIYLHWKFGNCIKKDAAEISKSTKKQT